MPQLLTLSRAARLVGVTRGALQKKIKTGELATFEGMVAAPDLQRVFPDTRLDEQAALERYTFIKDTAYARRIRERILPDPEVLGARLMQISRDLARAKGLVDQYRALFERLEGRFKTIEGRAIASWRPSSPTCATGCAANWSGDCNAPARRNRWWSRIMYYAS